MSMTKTRHLYKYQAVTLFRERGELTAYQLQGLMRCSLWMARRVIRMLKDDELILTVTRPTRYAWRGNHE